MRLLTASMRGRSSSGLRTGVEENRNCINRLNAAGTVQEKQANCKRLFRSAVPFRSLQAQARMSRAEQKCRTFLTHCSLILRTFRRHSVPSETSGTTYPMTIRHIAEDVNCHG